MEERLHYIAATKDEAEEEEQANNRDVRVYSDRSGFKGGIGTSAVLYRCNKPKCSLRFYLGSAGHHTIYEGELVGMLLANELLHTETGIKAMIGVDSQAAILAMASFKPAPGHYLVDMMHDQMKCLCTKMEKAAGGDVKARIEIIWTPGHRGIPGNEEADIVAKKAAKGNSSTRERLPTPLRRRGKLLPQSQSARKQTYKTELDGEAKRLLMLSPRYTRILEIDPNLSTAKFRDLADSLSRGQASLLFQLQTGHIPLNKHLHRIGKERSPRCKACNAAQETVLHFVLMCPVHKRHRVGMNAALGRSARSLKVLLSNQEAIPLLFDFIGATGRFREAYGQVEMVGGGQEGSDEGRRGNTVRGLLPDY